MKWYSIMCKWTLLVNVNSRATSKKKKKQNKKPTFKKRYNQERRETGII